MHQIELFEKYPAEVQNDVLLNLVDKAKNTIIGRDFGLSSIKSYEDFSKKVPVFSYENFSDKIELARKGENNIFWPTKIKWFAKSSGTTNSKSKFIPVSDESLEDCHYAAGKDLLCMYLNNNSDSQLFTGKSLRLGGSKSPYVGGWCHYHNEFIIHKVGLGTVCRKGCDLKSFGTRTEWFQKVREKRWQFLYEIGEN